MKTRLERIRKSKSHRRDPVLSSALPGRYYSRKEIAALAGVCVHTVAKDAKLGLLEEVHFNSRRIRSHQNAVRAYLAAEFDTTLAVKPCLCPAKLHPKSEKAANDHTYKYDGLDGKIPEGARTAEITPNPQESTGGPEKGTPAGAKKHIMVFLASRGQNRPVQRFAGLSSDCLALSGRLDEALLLASYLNFFPRTLRVPGSLSKVDTFASKTINN